MRSITRHTDWPWMERNPNQILPSPLFLLDPPPLTSVSSLLNLEGKPFVKGLQNRKRRVSQHDSERSWLESTFILPRSPTPFLICHRESRLLVLSKWLKRPFFFGDFACRFSKKNWAGAQILF